MKRSRHFRINHISTRIRRGVPEDECALQGTISLLCHAERLRYDKNEKKFFLLLTNDFIEFLIDEKLNSAIICMSRHSHTISTLFYRHSHDSLSTHKENRVLYKNHYDFTIISYCLLDLRFDVMTISINSYKEILCPNFDHTYLRMKTNFNPGGTSSISSS